MKTGSKNIDQLFKDTLSNFEADVNPSVWENIEQELQTPSGNIADKSVRPNQMFSKAKLKNIISFLVLSGAAILAILYFTSKKSASPLTPEVKTSQQAVSQPQTNQVPGKDVTASIVTIHKVVPATSVEEKQNRKQEEQRTFNTKSSISDDDHAKENVSSSTTTHVTDSKGNTVHSEKNNLSKNNSEPIVNSSASKKVENNRDVNKESESNADQASSEPDDSNYTPAEPDDSNRPNFRFWVPGKFTPNGDGINDYLVPQGLNFKDYEIKIYDALGSEIFNSTDIANSWDGKLRNGAEGSRGVYLYVVNVKDLNNEIHQYKGIVRLIR